MHLVYLNTVITWLSEQYRILLRTDGTVADAGSKVMNGVPSVASGATPSVMTSGGGNPPVLASGGSTAPVMASGSTAPVMASGGGGTGPITPSGAGVMPVYPAVGVPSMPGFQPQYQYAPQQGMLRPDLCMPMNFQ